MEELDGFRYRATDAWFQLTRGVIREARLKEIREEMINSQKLTSYFEDNPQDMKLLRHDKVDKKLFTMQYIYIIYDVCILYI